MEGNGLSSVTVGIQHPPKKPKLPKLLMNIANMARFHFPSHVTDVESYLTSSSYSFSLININSGTYRVEHFTGVVM